MIFFFLLANQSRLIERHAVPLCRLTDPFIKSATIQVIY